MKIPTKLKLSAALLAVILIISGCTTLNYYSYTDGSEPINWREYNDC
jgi:hypothetical protein